MACEWAKENSSFFGCGRGRGRNPGHSRPALCGFSLPLPCALAVVKCGGGRGGGSAWRKATPRCSRRRWSAVLCRARAARPRVLGSRPSDTGGVVVCAESPLRGRHARHALFWPARGLAPPPLSSSRPRRGGALLSRLSPAVLVFPVMQHVSHLPRRCVAGRSRLLCRHVHVCACVRVRPCASLPLRSLLCVSFARCDFDGTASVVVSA